MFHHQGRFLFDPSLIKVTAVQKGTGSASAGIGATSGAIVAQTMDAKDLLTEGKDVGFKVNAGLSSNKGYNGGLAVYGRAGGFDGLIVGNWITEKNYKAGGGYRSIAGNEEVLNSALGQRGLLGKISYNFNEDHRITLSHRQEKTYGTRALREEFDFSNGFRTERGRGSKPLTPAEKAQGYTVKNNIIYDPNGNAVSNIGNNQPRHRVLTNDTTNLEYTGKNMGFISQIKANVYRQNFKYQDGKAAISFGTSHLTTHDANLGFDSNILNKHTLKYGLNWRHQKAKPDNMGNLAVRQQKDDVGAYVEGIWSFEPVTLTTGLRYDRFKARFSNGKEVSDSAFSPSLGVIYDATPDLSFHSSLNYATRSPRLAEITISGGNDNLIGAENNLQAERSRNIELGVKYRLNDSLNAEANYFWQTIKDVQALNRDTRNYYNGGTLKNRGYEAALSYRWQGLTTRVGVAYNKPKMDGASIDSVVTAIPMGRTWTTGLSYRFNNPNLEIGWRGRFVESSEYDVATSVRGATVMTPTKRSGYGVNDLYLNWKPTGKDNLNINFAVNNIGNKLYKPHSQRTSNTGGGDASLPETGRDFRLGVNYRF